MKVPYIYKHTCSHCGRIDAIEMTHEEPELPVAVGRLPMQWTRWVPPTDGSTYVFNIDDVKWSKLNGQG